jgi:PIN domain nuclease of toxin-antitoxin system
VRVLADSHAIIWQSQCSPELSEDAANALLQAEATDGIVVSVASLVDLWYVTQTTKGISDG